MKFENLDITAHRVNAAPANDLLDGAELGEDHVEWDDCALDDHELSPQSSTAKFRGVPDKLLASAASEGDIEAYEELFIRYQAPLKSFILKRSPGHIKYLSEDLTKEVLLLVLSGKEHRYKPEKGAQFRTWLFKIASQRASRAARLKSNSAIQPHEGFWENQSNEAATAPHSSALIEALLSCIEHLDDRERLCIRHCYWNHATQKEVAAILRVAEATVTRLMRKAYETLKNCVDTDADLAEMPKGIS